MADRFSAILDDLEDITARFRRFADCTDETLRDLNRCVDDLRYGGWQGGGASAFLDEYDSEVAPRLRRYIEWMEEISSAVCRTMETSEELDAEVVALFQQGYASFEPPAASGARAGVEGAKLNGLTGRNEYRVSNIDGGLNGDPNANTLYVNGIQTSGDQHRETLASLSNRFGKPVAGIYNKTDSFTKDIYQALNDQLQAKTGFRVFNDNPAVQSAMDWIRDHPNAEIYAHSQGGAIISAALMQLRRDGFDLSGLRVTTMGGAGIDFPPGPQYHHIIHEQDLVPVGVRTFLDPLSLITHKLDSEVTVISDPNATLNPLDFDEHNVEHYLDNTSQFNAERSTENAVTDLVGDVLRFTLRTVF